MLASRIAALTIATGALVVSAGPAFADVEVNPNPVSPGGAVWVNDGYRDLLCPSSDTWAIAKSEGFKDDTIKLTRDDSDHNKWTRDDDHHALSGMGWAVDRPGTYDVSITCASDKSSDKSRDHDHYTLVVSARGSAHTGDGASLISSGTGDAAGLALLGGALAVGAVVVRRKIKADR
jgi:hypothetical protein